MFAMCSHSQLWFNEQLPVTTQHTHNSKISAALKTALHEKGGHDSKSQFVPRRLFKLVKMSSAAG